MKRLISICVFQIILVYSTTIPPKSLIGDINSKNSTWKAGLNFPEETHAEHVKQRVGFLKSHPDPSYQIPRKVVKIDSRAIPEHFDARQQWPNCSESIGHIRDQGNCTASWVFAPAEVMSDRLCIQSRGRVKFEFSVEEMISCCSCGFNTSSCDGGYLLLAWEYWKQEGIVSGGDYGSNEGCKPYGEQLYLHHTTPECVHSCTNTDYETSYEDDLQFGFNYYAVSEGDVAGMQSELMVHGPLQVEFTVYEDFLHYKEGVYQHILGEKIGGIYLKIVGWGVVDDVPYWLVANSWGTSWGNLNGYVKIRRGYNECGIEYRAIVANAEYNEPITTVATTTTTTTTKPPGDHGSTTAVSSGLFLLTTYLLVYNFLSSTTLTLSNSVI